jgi:hypothetical protein
VERQRHAKLDAGELKQLAPEPAGENRVTVTHYGVGNVVYSHDHVEEDSDDQCRCVGVVNGDEVYRLGKPVDHCEDHELAIDVRNPSTKSIATSAQTMNDTSRG